MGKVVAVKMVNDNVDQIGQTLGYVASGVAVVGGIAGLWIAICRWFKRRKARSDALHSCVESLGKWQKEISAKLEAMEEARNHARLDDAQVRSNLYLGQIAMIAAIRELGKNMNPPIKINGEVQKYYDLNIEALRSGLGMEPLHARTDKGSGKGAV
jgi:hypothetical protein